jgi:hypothetical protein
MGFASGFNKVARAKLQDPMKATWPGISRRGLKLMLKRRMK